MNFDSIESEVAMFSRALKQTSVALYSSLHGKARWKLAGSLLGNALMVRRLRQDSSFSPRHGGRLHGEEVEEENTEYDPEAPGSRTVKIGSPEQPDIAQFPAFLRSRHSRLHRVVLMDSHERGNLKRLRGASRSRSTNKEN